MYGVVNPLEKNYIQASIINKKYQRIGFAGFTLLQSG